MAVTGNRTCLCCCGNRKGNILLVEPGIEHTSGGNQKENTASGDRKENILIKQCLTATVKLILGRQHSKTFHQISLSNSKSGHSSVVREFILDEVVAKCNANS